MTDPTQDDVSEHRFQNRAAVFPSKNIISAPQASAVQLKPFVSVCAAGYDSARPEVFTNKVIASFYRGMRFIQCNTCCALSAGSLIFQAVFCLCSNRLCSRSNLLSGAVSGRFLEEKAESKTSY